ncbi:hypothetical protein [Streptomyces olivaceus]
MSETAEPAGFTASAEHKAGTVVTVEQRSLVVLSRLCRTGR